MPKNYKLLLIVTGVTIFLVFTLLPLEIFAQCPMCKASAESSIKGGSTMALGLNKGILYLLLFPYLLFSVIFFLWYYQYRKNKVVTY